MEKRESIRLEKTLPVKFDLLGSPAGPSLPRTFEALTRNISEGGLFIESGLAQDKSFALDKDALLNLEIELLGQAQGIKPQGRIAWVSRKSRSPQKKRDGFGISFIQMTVEEKRAISLFISKETRGKIEIVEKEIPVISREQKLTDRQRRNLEILDAIRKKGLISRAEISKNTGVNIVTVSNYIDTYLKKALVFERGLDISTGGRRPELIEINPRYGYVIGADCGPLNESCALMQAVACDFTTRVKVKVQEKIEGDNDNIEDWLDILKSLIAKVVQSQEVQKEKIRGIGMGVAGIMDKFSGSIRNPLTRNTFANCLTIKKELQEEFDLPVFIENSATCALFAEKWTGINLEAKAADNIIYIFSDNQCAIMLKGELYTGSSNSVGQLNFAVARALIDKNSLTKQNNFSNTDYCWMKFPSDCVFHSQTQGLEAAAKESRDVLAFGAKMGAKIAYLVNVFNPQVVIIGSTFSSSGDIFLDVVRRTVNRWAFKENTNIVRIIPATLGKDAVAVGAAALVIEAALVNI